MLAALEAGAAPIAVVLDLLVPTLVLLAMTAVSLLARRRGLGSLGLHRFCGVGLVVKMLVLAIVWSVFQLGVTLPVAPHVSGEQQDLSQFDGLQGGVGMLIALLLLSWTLAAFGEEVAYRGYLLTRLREAAGGGRRGVVVGVLVSSVLFGVAHAEQGLVGVGVVTLDAIAWSVVPALRHALGADTGARLQQHRGIHGLLRGGAGARVLVGGIRLRHDADLSQLRCIRVRSSRSVPGNSPGSTW